MRVALLSDIHGNCFALDAVLAALAAESIDQIVCLGDVAIFGPQPRAALTRIKVLGCPVVMGNTDAWALDPQPLPMRNEESHYFNAIERWSADQLTAADLAYIQTFQPTVNIDLVGATLLCYHGSPRSCHDMIVATTAPDELIPMFGDTAALILAGGHTHAQYARRYLDKIMLNPGSVGLPYEALPDSTVRNPPWAEYAIVTWLADNLQVELRRVAYDSRELIAYTRTTDMPYADWWLKDLITTKRDNKV